MKTITCQCGAKVYRRKWNGRNVLCERIRRHILPGPGEASGIDRRGRMIRGIWALANVEGAVDVAPLHAPRCAVAGREARLPYADL